jgi:hypothetical protein
MADTLVLAELTIDANGVITGMAATVDAFKKGERSLNNFGAESQKSAKHTELLTSRMFNLKNAVTAALGGFTIAGAILSLRNIATDALRASDNFAAMDQSMGRAYNSLLKTLGVFVDLDATVKSTSIYLDTIANTLDRFKTSGPGKLWEYLWGNTTAGELMALYNAGAKYLEAAGLSATPATPVESPPNLGQPTGRARHASAYQLAGSPYAPAAIKLDLPPNLADQVREYGNAITGATDAFSRFREVHGFGPGGEGTGEGQVPDLWLQEAGGIEDVTEKFKGMNKAILDATTAFSDFGIIAPAVLDAVSAAASAGVISATTAARLQEAILAAQSIMQGKIELAKAVAAYAAHDYHGATLHGVAAGLFFSAAAFHGVSAINPTAYGVASATAARNGSSALALADTRGSSGAPNVTVIVQGSVLGTSTQQLAREMVVLWQKGAKDMGGGNLVVAGASR